MGVFVFFGCPVQVVDQSEHKQEERKDLAAGEMTFLFGIGNTLAIWGKASEIKKHGHVIHQLASKKTNPENVRRTFQNFRRFCRTLPVLLRRFGPLLRRTFAPIAFLLFFHVNLSFFELLRTLPRGSQKHGPQSSQRTSQKSEKFSELLRRFSGSVFELFFVVVVV